MFFRRKKISAAAETELQKAMEADENYLPAYSAYAALLVERNQTDRAIEQYKKIVEKKPSASVYTLLGMLEDARQNFDESENNYRKALEISPETPIAANNLAWNIAAYNRGNLDEALRLAQTNVSKNPGNASFYDTLGWIYFKKGLYSPAARTNEKSRRAGYGGRRTQRKAGNARVSPAFRSGAGFGGRQTERPERSRTALQNQKDLSEKELQDAKSLLAGL